MEKKKKFITALVSMMFAFSFSNLTTVSNADDYPTDSSAYLIGIDCAGMVVVSGFAECPNMWDTEFATVKYNSYGKKQWHSHYDRPQGNSADFPNSLAITPTGEVIVAGSSDGIDTYSYDGNTERDFTTVKYNPYGDQQWIAIYDSQKLPSTPWHQSDMIHFVSLDRENNIYVVGTTCTPSEEKSYCCNAVTIKYNPEGEELWVSKYDTCVDNAEFSLIHGFAVDGDGHSYVLADTESFGEDVVVEYDTYGNNIWTQIFEMDWNDIAADSNGNFYLFGNAPSSLDDDFYFALNKYNSENEEMWSEKTQTNTKSSKSVMIIDNEENIYVGTAVSDEGIFTVKFDIDGNVLWLEQFDGSLIDDLKLKTDAEGNLVVLAEYLGGDIEDVIIKYDKEGTLLWAIEYYWWNYTESDLDFIPRDLAFDDDGNLYVAGKIYYYDGPVDYYIYATIMYDKNGNEKWISEYNEGCGESEVLIEFDHPCYHGLDDDSNDADDDSDDDDEDSSDNDNDDSCGCGCS